jgi:hypothetical protein
MRWLERLEDRCPVWALPWLLLAAIAAVIGAAGGLGRSAARCGRR